MKSFVVLFLLITVAVSAPAGEDTSVVSKADKNVPSRQKNTALAPLKTERYEYYEVCGCCEEDLQCEMMEKAIRWKDGRKYDSVTRWKVKWDYEYNRESRACFADSFRVSIDITIHLPKWVCGHAPQPLRDKWENYIEKLTLHENGHRDLALEAAADLSRAVAELSPARTCADLDRTVNDLCHERMQKLDEDQEAYDEKTGHGFAKVSFP